MSIVKEDNYLQEFLSESFKNLSEMVGQLSCYEKNPKQRELIDSIYRKIHTLRTSGGLLGFKKIESTAYSLETVLDEARTGKIKDHRELVGISLMSVNAFMEILNMIAQTGSEGEREYSDIISQTAGFAEKELVRERISAGEKIVDLLDDEIKKYIEDPQKSNHLNQVCKFRIGDDLYVISVLKVQEILHGCSAIPIPLSPDYINGLINLRGQVVIEVGLRKLMKIKGNKSEKCMNIIVRADESFYSLEVDEVVDIIEVDQNNLEEAPGTIDNKILKFLDGIYKLNDRILMSLNLDKVLNI